MVGGSGSGSGIDRHAPAHCCWQAQQQQVRERQRAQAAQAGGGGISQQHCRVLGCALRMHFRSSERQRCRQKGAAGAPAGMCSCWRTDELFSFPNASSAAQGGAGARGLPGSEPAQQLASPGLLGASPAGVASFMPSPGPTWYDQPAARPRHNRQPASTGPRCGTASSVASTQRQPDVPARATVMPFEQLGRPGPLAALSRGRQ